MLKYNQLCHLYLLEFNAESKDSENFEAKDENKVKDELDTNYEEDAMMEKDPSNNDQDSAYQDDRKGRKNSLL